MGADTGLAALNRYAPASISAGRIGRKIQIQEHRPEKRSVRVVCCGAGANCEDFAGARPVEIIFVLENLSIRVRLCTLADGGRRIVHPGPAANGELGDWTQRAGEGGFAAVHETNSEAWCSRTISYARGWRSVANLK